MCRGRGEHRHARSGHVARGAILLGGNRLLCGRRLPADSSGLTGITYNGVPMTAVTARR
jgi:hypothetical protein